MNILVDLPSGIDSDLLTCWLGLKDICNLDSAFCNTTLRTKLLALLNYKETIFLPQTEKDISVYTKWAISRRICLKGVILNLDADTQNLDALLAITGLHLQKITITGSENSTDCAMPSIASMCHNLVEFTISDCNSTKGLRAILSENKQLIGLYTNCCKNMNASIFRSLSLPNIQHLSFADNDIDDATLIAAVQACPQLRALDVTNNVRITDASALKIAKHCSALQTLHLIGNETIRDAAVAAVLRNCPRLTTLGLDYCNGLSATTVFSIATHCQHMQRLYLGNIRISDDCLMNVVNGCGASLLVLRIDTASATDVTDEGMQAIADTCPLLQSLSVYGAEHITDAGVIAVATSCPALLTLDIGALDQITDAALFAIADHCHLLQKLNVAYCPQLTGNGIFALGSQLQQLRLLIVEEEHPLVCIEFVWQILSNTCPNLQISSDSTLITPYYFPSEEENYY